MSLFITKDEFETSKIKFKKYNLEWKKFASKKYVGDCSDLYKRLKPTSYEDFYKKYIFDGEKGIAQNCSIYNRGRTEMEIIDNAKELYLTISSKYPNDEIKFNDCLNVSIGHVIYETYDGQKIEDIVEIMLSDKGYLVKKPSSEYDSKFGIDRLCYYNGILSFTVQIKPISFFHGDKNLSLIEDRKKAFNNDERIMKCFNVIPYYIVYEKVKDSVTFLYKDKNKMAFRLGELCESNGNSKWSKLKTDKRFYFNKI